MMAEVGDRIELIRCNDPYTRLRPGMRGIVMSIDSTGTVGVRWDDGSCLGMVEEAGDQYKVVGEP